MGKKKKENECSRNFVKLNSRENLSNFHFIKEISGK